MGQQQLLLLVLGIVIVGLAVVVGIQAFGENQKKANSDAMTNDVIRIVSDAQAWNLKPTAFGGGNGSFVGVTLEKLGYTVTGPARATATSMRTTASSAAGGRVGSSSRAARPSTGNLVQATATGTAPAQHHDACQERDGRCRLRLHEADVSTRLARAARLRGS